MISPFSRCLVYILMLSMFSIGCAPTGTPKSPEALQKASEIESMVKAKTFDIKVNRAITNKGRTINLTSTYGLSLTPEKFTCDLPFYGEAFAGAGYGGSGPVSFTSTDFSIETNLAKKGGWDLTIKPKDQQDVRTAGIYISETGYATLNFVFQSRTAMQYYGSVVSKN